MKPQPAAPFGLIDELSCYYDTRAEPNNVHVEALVPGGLDYQALRQAVADALAATPRARGRMAAGGPLRGRYTWEFPSVLDVDPVSRATWADERELGAVRARFLATAPSLRHSPPVLLLLASGPDADCVLLNAHHAALDGLSCLGLLRDIGARYRVITAAGEPASGATASQQAGQGHDPAGMTGAERLIAAAPGLPPESHPDHSSAADHSSPADHGSSDRGPSPLARARAVAGLLRQRPARIAALPGPRGRRDGVGVHLLLVPSVPRPPGATVNDVLLTALIATIGRWNAAHRKRLRPVRITVPVDARGPDSRQATGNHSAIVPVTAYPPGAGDDLSPLLAEVTRQTSALRHARPRQPSAGVLGVAPGWCPVLLKRLAVRLALRVVGRIVCDTCLLTNLGNVTDPPWSGAGGPVRMAMTSAARMPRGLSVGVVTADGQLQLAFRYRYAQFDAAAAARFAASYAAVLDELGKEAVSEGGNTRAVAGRTAQDPRVPGR